MINLADHTALDQPFGVAICCRCGSLAAICSCGSQPAAKDSAETADPDSVETVDSDDLDRFAQGFSSVPLRNSTATTCVGRSRRR